MGGYSPEGRRSAHAGRRGGSSGGAERKGEGFLPYAGVADPHRRVPDGGGGQQPKAIPLPGRGVPQPVREEGTTGLVGDEAAGGGLCEGSNGATHQLVFKSYEQNSAVLLFVDKISYFVLLSFKINLTFYHHFFYATIRKLKK